MNSLRLARLVATACGVVHTLWAPTTNAQTALAPDLVVSKVGLTCAGMVVTVANTGRTAVSASASSIEVRVVAVMSTTFRPGKYTSLSVASLEPGQTRTVTLSMENAAGATAISATVDAAGRLTEADESNNERAVIDERSCPLLKVSDARVVEGGDLVFTVSIEGRPQQDATVTWYTAGTNASGGAACGETIDYITQGGSLKFAASEFIALTPKTIRITTCRDAHSESAETMHLNFMNFRNVAMIKSSRIGTIDNKSP